MLGIIGKKIGMSQLFDKDGKLYPVTIVEAGPCPVVQVKTEAKDGYSAIQMGFDEIPERKATKPQIGHFKATNAKLCRHLIEFKNFDTELSKVGQEISVGIFKAGQKIKITGTSKGKGFQGVVRKFNFRGGPKTHGQSDRLRAPGSIGQSSWPSRVIKGMKMAGRMGGKVTTVKNLQIIRIDEEKNLIYIKGAVPGSINGIVQIRRQES